MSDLGVILVMAAGMYTMRLSGFLLAGAAMPPAWERALGFVPVATLTALVVSTLVGRPDEAPIRLVAAAAAGLAAWRIGPAWACIGAGMLVYWLLRLV